GQLSQACPGPELQASRETPSDILILSREVRASHQFDNVTKTIVKPCKVGGDPVLRERLLHADFPASGALRQQIGITEKETIRTEVLCKTRLLDSASRVEAHPGAMRQPQRNANLGIGRCFKCSVVLDPDACRDIQSVPYFHLLLQVIAAVIA